MSRRIDAEEKASGRTRYLADRELPGQLQALLVRSERPRARLGRIVLPELPAGYTVVDRRDVPGRNRIVLIRDDWPAFAEDRVDLIGEIILMLVGPDLRELLRLREQVRVDYEELPPAFTIEEAELGRGGPIFGEDNLFADIRVVKGDPDDGFRRAARVVEDLCRTGFQEHVYLEPQSMAGAWEDGRVVLYGSLQCPFYVHRAACAVLGCGADGVRVVQTPTGGGFGGKEDYPEILGALLAVAVHKVRRPVRLVLDRGEDLAFTSKRHPAEIRYRTALDESGAILAMEIDLRLNGGAHESYSSVVLQRAVFTSANVYDLPAARVCGRAYATNLPPSGAFRGFGGPQAIFGIETHLLHVAREAGVEPLEYKRRYLLRQGSPTLTGGAIHEPVLLEEMIRRAQTMSGYGEKKRRYGRGAGRGAGLSLFLHGCGFTGDGEQQVIRGRVRLARRADGRVEVLTAGAEIGQGLRTVFRAIVARALGRPPETVLVEEPDTARVPDSGPTAASRSTMVVGYLLQEAARELAARWGEPGEIVVEKGYSPPPWLRWDQGSFRGDAYAAYGWGVNVVEVEVDPVTAEVGVKGAWAVYDVGTVLDRQAVTGQAEGGMAQALGWAALERLTPREGRFEQRSLSDYVIPTSLDLPPLELDLMDNPYPYGPFGAKGAGELTFDGAAPAFLEAVEQATGLRFAEIPLTPEVIMAARAGQGGA